LTIQSTKINIMVNNNNTSRDNEMSNENETQRTNGAPKENVTLNYLYETLQYLENTIVDNVEFLQVV
jgi:hypothetical protein